MIQRIRATSKMKNTNTTTNGNRSVFFGFPILGPLQQTEKTGVSVVDYGS